MTLSRIYRSHLARSLSLMSTPQGREFSETCWHPGVCCHSMPPLDCHSPTLFLPLPLVHKNVLIKRHQQLVSLCLWPSHLLGLLVLEISSISMLEHIALQLLALSLSRQANLNFVAQVTLTAHSIHMHEFQFTWLSY